MSHRLLLPIASLIFLIAGTAGCDRGSVGKGLRPSAVPSSGGLVTSGGGATSQAGSAVMGSVTDSANQNPIAGAIVEVVTGSSHGLTAIADAKGLFSLVGNFDDTTEIRARREGYVLETKTLGERCANCTSWPLSFSLLPN